ETIEEQRIAICEIESGRVREVSPENLYVYDYDWSPDGATFVAEAAPGSGTNNYWIAKLYALRADTGEARTIYEPTWQIACPRVSPDGKNVALIEGLMSDEGYTGGDVVVVPANGGAPARNVTPELHDSVSALAWLEPDRILASEYVDGGVGFA